MSKKETTKKSKKAGKDPAAPGGQNRAARRAALREAYIAEHGEAPAPVEKAPKEVASPEIKKKERAPKVDKPFVKKVREPRFTESEPSVQEVAEALGEVESEETQAPAVQVTGFEDLGLSAPIVQAIADLGFEAPTPIQAQAIPVLLQGRDIIGQAQTGTGKTAAFALPIIQGIHVENVIPQAIVLAPTRELAVQVAGGIHNLAKHTGIRVVPVYGGQPIDRQFRASKMGAHIVVGTPGRIIDHLRRGSLSLDTVSFCVLDEADEMLALGFLEDVEEILAALPEKRQTAFFSATMPAKIKALTKRFLQSPEHIAIVSRHSSSP